MKLMWKRMMPATIEPSRDGPMPPELAEALKGKAAFTNGEYTCVVEELPPPMPGWPTMFYLSIKRNDREPIRDWRALQRIKNDVMGPEAEGVELFPAESRLVDNANQFHMWCLPTGHRFPFGFNEREVSTGNVGGAKQREWDEGDAPDDVRVVTERDWQKEVAVAAEKLRDRRAAERTCGECRECCLSLAVPTMDKHAGVWCKHAEGDHVGCAIYDERPGECRAFRCAWLQGFFSDDHRPDKIGVVFWQGTQEPQRDNQGREFIIATASESSEGALYDNPLAHQAMMGLLNTHAVVVMRQTGTRVRQVELTIEGNTREREEHEFKGAPGNFVDIPLVSPWDVVDDKTEAIRALATGQNNVTL